MSNATSRPPLLVKYFGRYLSDEDAAGFIRAVSEQYALATLERLAAGGSAVTRRAAVLAIGYLGNFENNAVLGRALRDDDRGVRVLAESGIRELWVRDGDPRQRQWLRQLIRLNAAGQFGDVVEQSTRLLEEAPTFAEAWNQRAMARFYLEQYSGSVEDCRRALSLNPYHFEAAVGMGQGLIELNEPRQALDCFHRALKVNPDLEGIRAHVRSLRRILD
ncbi:MAG: tetratricopeptide repeat protein [Pirellulaceae bacterium]|nr:tetratricopeptide repeat protein [Pirellulaceae bacterium]